MACRVAGNNDSPETLWQSLLDKRDASGVMPSFRWEPYYRRDPRNAKELKQMTSRGYFVDNIQDFDCSFFGISPKEAILMDPQQRISLEVTWEALEDAGIPPQSLAGSNTSVFMGVNSDDYGKLLLEDLPGIEAWMGIGTAYCGIPNRISYVLDLKGPSTAVDAACASSLVAIHHGRQSLLARESDCAIVGGVNVLCGPGLTKVLDIAGAVSAEGKCRSFDESANGYGRGEGAGVIILKRMKDALKDEDRILAVLKGTSVGQDGRTNGIMAPNGAAQEMVARNALRAANIDPRTVQYVEAHATSTSVGDPVEIQAISNVYGRSRDATSPCYVGSIKPNIGHLEAGAGVMGFIKSVLAIRHCQIPPQANLDELNRKIDWETSGIQVSKDLKPWPDVEEERRAAICSYGYGGTVSHAVIEAAPMGSRFLRTISEQRPTILILTVPQKKRMSDVSGLLRQHLKGTGDRDSLESIAATLATRRGHHDYRAAVVASDITSACQSLDNLTRGSSDPSVILGQSLGAKASKGAVWVFSGHGAQWSNMGQELLRHDKAFYTAVAHLEETIRQEAGFSPLAALEKGDFSTSDHVQVLTYVMQIGITASLLSKGASPKALIGHSVGEIAAAVVSSAITDIEGAIIVSRRAQLYRKMMGKGAMILVHSAPEGVTKELGTRDDVAVAIYSSPSSCVVSGAVDSICLLREQWRARGIKVLNVKTDIAFHSPALNCIGQPLLEKLADDIKPRPPVIKLYSTAVEDPRATIMRDATYWLANMINPVQLTKAVKAATEDGFHVFLEVSSHPVVAQSIEETVMDLETQDAVILSTLRRDQPTRQALTASLGSLWVAGIDIRWKRFFEGVKWIDDVPRTPWNHQKFWREIGTGLGKGVQGHDLDKHTLLGARTQIAGNEAIAFQTTLDDTTKPFPGSHPLHGTEIVPAAVLFNTFVQASDYAALSNVLLRVPVAVSAPREVQVIMESKRVRLVSRLIQDRESNGAEAGDSWLTHTTAEIKHQNALKRNDINVGDVATRIGNKIKSTFVIDYLASVGVPAMGFPWVVDEHFSSEQEMLAKVNVSPSTDSSSPLPWDGDSWAPVLDAATSIGSTIFSKPPRLRMPSAVDSFEVLPGACPPRQAYIHVVASSRETCLAADITIHDESGNALAVFERMQFAEIEGTPGASTSVENLVHQLTWIPATLAEKPRPFNHVVIIAAHGDTLCKKYEEQLAQMDIQTTILSSSIQLMKNRDLLVTSSSIVVVLYIPGQVEDISKTASSSKSYCHDLLGITRFVISNAPRIRIFAVTQNAIAAQTPTSLAHAPLLGLGRIIAAEQPDLWGGVIDTDGSDFPLQAIRYIPNADVIKIEDTVSKVCRLRPMPHDKLLPVDAHKRIMPKAGGTYVITGGLGALGLETLDFLVERGARRIVLVSRNGLPSRSEWAAEGQHNKAAIDRIHNLEESGVYTKVIALDLSTHGAASRLHKAISDLGLPPVRGIVHAAGVLENQLVTEITEDAFNKVLDPKIAGALAVHQAFPAGTLDFSVWFSSCGQLFGFPGQASYASGNAFLDSLANHRRVDGEQAVAFQWTSWRGLGMAGSTDFIEAELEAKGITSVTREDAFRAWDHVSKYDMSHAVILRSRAVNADEQLPMQILQDIAPRRHNQRDDAVGEIKQSSIIESLPPAGAARNSYLESHISECVASVLQLPSREDVDAKIALPELGMDSVMTVAFRRQLQQKLKVKVPPTLVWGHPTVSHLTRWFAEKLSE